MKLIELLEKRFKATQDESIFFELKIQKEDECETDDLSLHKTHNGWKTDDDKFDSDYANEDVVEIEIDSNNISVGEIIITLTIFKENNEKN